MKTTVYRFAESHDPRAYLYTYNKEKASRTATTGCRRHRKAALAIIICLIFFSPKAMGDTIRLRFIETSDVHGCFFPYDFIERKPKAGSMARVATYVDSLRQRYGDRLILLENGDILQGQPTCYYCNYVNTRMPNVAASIVNYMRYDAQNMGNHDIETGHDVYDRWIGEVNCPVLGANIIDTVTGKPYLTPYIMINTSDGIRIAVLGLITPAIPNWLNNELWSGLRFEEMTSCAARWMDYIRENEHPDVVIGLFHSGKEGGITTDEYAENASLRVAREVPGFDIVFFGHDHARHKDYVQNTKGDTVLCLDPSCNALMVADAEVQLVVDNGKVTAKRVRGRLVDIGREPVSDDFMRRFQAEIDSVNNYVSRCIGSFTAPVCTRDSYFGNSAFCDLIHNMQLDVTGADISFNAPLTFDATIDAGGIYVSDMFKLYKYENLIYVMRMTGAEIRRHLEMSYDLWTNTMTSPDDHIMLLADSTIGDGSRRAFRNLAFNFDSAAGIDYEVDVTQPCGSKVRILRMSNGQPFSEDKWYNVVMNSYRGNGGGELLTKGAGIPHDSLPGRLVFKSQMSQRQYLTEYIERAGIIDPKPNDNWRFVPDSWTQQAIVRDKELLFGTDK